MKSWFTIFCSHKSLISYGVPVLAAFFLVSACAAPSRQSAQTIAGSPYSQIAKDAAAGTEIEKRLRQEYNRWRGTQHRLGATGRRGIDCSGFVQAVYRDVFNVDLPRTTKAQVGQGRPVPFSKLQAGDLVFFQPPTYPRHVGIYLGGSEFVHASKNKGVTVSKIDDYYWGKYYWTARRILSGADRP